MTVNVSTEWRVACCTDFLSYGASNTVSTQLVSDGHFHVECTVYCAACTFGVSG
jgi:hypothetical protein